MDRFTRNYSIGLAIATLLLFTLLMYENPVVSDLNDQLEADTELSSYPYAFRVLRVNNGYAIMSTPRSSEFPVFQALGIIYPKLANRPQDDPELMQAQDRLATLQKKAKAIVIKDERIKGASWELDREWLSSHGVLLVGNR
jgi:hypothetical protein